MRIHIGQRHIVSTGLVAKGAVGVSMAVLALYGSIAPLIGASAGTLEQGVVAVAGAVIGALLALRS